VGAGKNTFIRIEGIPAAEAEGVSRFRVLINGTNFLLRFTDQFQQKKKYGFYTTRDVEAGTIEEACEKAIEVMKNDDNIKSITLNSRKDPPMLRVDEISILADDEELVAKWGYTYYPEDEDS
jgi:hypothetical protein